MKKIQGATARMSGPLVLLFALGCATSGVKSSQTYTEGALPKPSVLLIYDFATSPDEALAQAYGSEFASASAKDDELARKTARTLSDQLQRKLTGFGIDAARVEGSYTPPVHAMVIKGEFLTVDEGSRVMRLTIGLGAGATQLRARVQAYQMTERGLLRIAKAEVESKGDKLPGMAAPVGVGAAAGNAARVAVISGGMNVVQEVTGGLDRDAGRMAGEIAERVKAFYMRQGWL